MYAIFEFGSNTNSATQICDIVVESSVDDLDNILLYTILEFGSDRDSTTQMCANIV